MTVETAETDVAILRARLDRMTRLAAAQGALAEADLDLDAFMQAIVEHLADLTGAKGAIVELVDGGDIVYRAATDKSLIGARLKRENSFSGLCVATAEVQVCRDALTDDRVDRDACIRVGVGSMVCAPLMHAAQALGVLKVFSGEKAAFDDDDIDILRVLASLLGAQMSHQLAFQQNEILLAEKTRALESAAWEAQQRAAQEELFETAFHHAPIGMALVELDGKLGKVNSAFCDIIGYPPREARALDFQTITHPDDLEADLALLNRLLAGEIKRYQMEKRYIRKDGQVICVRLSVSLVRGNDGAAKHFIAQIQDLTDQRAIENRYRWMAENATDVIVISDLQGVASFVSPASEVVTGYKPEERMGHSPKPISHPDDTPALYEAFKGLLKGKAAGRVRWRALHKHTGDYVWVESNPVLMRDDVTGQPTGFLDVIRDVTAQKAQEDALAQARLDAEAAMRSKADFLANMSHELRTPLNSIIGFSRLLTESSGLCAEDQRRVELVHGAGQALHAVIDNVLDFSKLEAAALELHKAPFDPVELLRQAVAMMEPQAAAKDLRLKTMIDSDAPLGVVGDAGRVRQVLLNLLSNAVKFTSRGGVTASLMRVGGNDAAPRLRVEITDTGSGISEGKQDGIFNRFVQAGSSVSAHYGGTGLGLAISRQLIALMGGDIGVESAVGRGSTFWFELALPAADAKGAEPVAEAQPLRLSGRRILVVDDVELNRELMLALLSKYGCEVGLAEDGAQAIEALEQGVFDLVLMDCQMPVMDGFAATETIRASGRAYADMPIVALTASAQPEHLARCEAAGMNDHLTKPLNLGALERVLDMMLRAPATSSPQVAPADDAGEVTRKGLVEVMGAPSVRALLGILMTQLDIRFAQTDAKTVREDAHALAGSAGMMGFPDLSQACRDLEAVIVAGGDHDASLDLTRGLVSRTITIARRWEAELIADAPEQQVA